MYKQTPVFLVVALTTLIVVIHLLSVLFFLYWRFFWLDMAMHFLGGFWVGCTTLWFLYFSKYKIKNNTKTTYINFICVVLVTLLVGVLWEVSQVVFNVFTNKEINEAIDTTSDILFGIVGAFFAALYFQKIYLNKK